MGLRQKTTITFAWMGMDCWALGAYVLSFTNKLARNSYAAKYTLVYVEELGTRHFEVLYRLRDWDRDTCKYKIP